MRKFKVIVLFIFVGNLVWGQSDDNYSDKLLSTSFKAYQEVDFELSNHMFPFIKKRFLEHLADSTSFSNPYDSLSNYIKIIKSPDDLLKTYSWSERDTGCCYSSEIYAQFKTKAGEIKFIDLKDGDDGDQDNFITDLYAIVINNKPYYLILGWGTCCGGTHYANAKVYEIRDGSLYKCETIFNDKDDVFIQANRNQRISLNYSPEEKMLSYNSYGEMNDSGFYGEQIAVVKWKLEKQGFKKIK